MRRHLLPAILALLFICSVALADDQVNGVGAPYWTTSQAITNTTACITDGAQCALFPAGTSGEHKQKLVIAYLEGSVALSCAWTGNGAATISGQTITDTGGEFGDSGKGPVFRVGITNVRYDSKPQRRFYLFTRAIGASRGLCSNKFRSGGELLYAPCRAGGDCTNFGGGSCNTAPTPDQLAYASVKLVCVGDTAGPSTLTLTKEFVDKEADVLKSE